MEVTKFFEEIKDIGFYNLYDKNNMEVQIELNPCHVAFGELDKSYLFNHPTNQKKCKDLNDLLNTKVNDTETVQDLIMYLPYTELQLKN